MNILLWLVLGAAAGGLAGKIMGGEKRGLLGNILVGVLGAVVGGFVASFLGWGPVDGFNFRSLLVAVGGACLLLWLRDLIQKKGK